LLQAPPGEERTATGAVGFDWNSALSRTLPRSALIQ
jgi:hypothetical protein